MDTVYEERIQSMIDDILMTISYEEFERELRKIGHYHAITFNVDEEEDESD